MKSFLILISGILIGCSVVATGQLRLQDRELLIHPDKAALAYPMKVTECIDRKKPWRWLGKKCKKKQVVIEYDMNKNEDRQKLINAAFTCKSALRFKY